MGKIVNIYKYAPQNFDILFLGYHDTSIKYIYKIINKYIEQASSVYGLFGYIVTQSGAKKLLDMFPITKQIDTEISMSLSHIDAYVVAPEYRLIFSDE